MSKKFDCRNTERARFLQLAWDTIIRYPIAGWQALAVSSSLQKRFKQGCGCFSANQPGATPP
jgi:hypothetical protein